VDVMERRLFLKLSVGFIAGAVTLASNAQAAPLPPISVLPAEHGGSAEPAVVSQQEVDSLKPEQVRWGHHGHHRHWGWHHRHWGWHHRHWGWRHRHWGWRHRHHHWHRRHWW
jgi:hypothetical protein